MRRWVETWLARLTERIRELIPETGWCVSEWAICDFQWGDGWWARKGDSRWGAGTARGLNTDQIVKIARLTGCKNFVGKRKKCILNDAGDVVGLLFDSVSSVPQSTAVCSGHQRWRVVASVGLVWCPPLRLIICKHGTVSCTPLF